MSEENMCDVCAGTGNPNTGSPCICGGSGKASDAVPKLREMFFDTQSKLRSAVALVEKMKEALSTIGEMECVIKLYEGPPCLSRHSDEHVIKTVQHGENEATLNVGHLRASKESIALADAWLKENK